jgi:predicted metal-binding protein
MFKEQIEKILQSNGVTDYEWVSPQRDIALAHWVRFKCMFGCNEYGKVGSCPPAVPPVDECHKMIREDTNALILHFSIQSQTKDEKHQLMTNLLTLELEIFLAGYYKVFLMPHHSCMFCDDCVADGTRIKCVDKAKSRPSPDAMGIDVFQTARNAGYSIEVVPTRDSMTNRFSFVLID